jgi:hypothetical protein
MSNSMMPLRKFGALLPEVTGSLKVAVNIRASPLKSPRSDSRSIAGGVGVVYAKVLRVSPAGSTRLNARIPESGAIAVAVKVTGGSSATVAVSVLMPNAFPSVHSTDARPASFVVCVAELRLPPPLVIANVTTTPGTG